MRARPGNLSFTIALLLLIARSLAFAQGPPPFHPPPAGGGLPPPHDGGPGPNRPPRQSLSLRAISRKWWNDPEVTRRLTLSNDQQRRLEASFQDQRVKLIDLTAALERAEAVLDPLLAADHPDDAKVFAQIDRVSQARAALESATARMLYSFRLVLTTDQWRQLQQYESEPHRPPGGGPGH